MLAHLPAYVGVVNLAFMQPNASYTQGSLSLGGTLDMQRQISGSGLTTSATRLQVGVPLFRGRGVQVTTANERAAGLVREGAALDLRQVTATVAGATANARDPAASGRVTNWASPAGFEPAYQG